jgi:glutamate racemase
MGGLTVVHAIIDLLPQESLLYFGDTAHVPYGPQPKASIIAYSEKISAYLLARGCKAIVVACNTATTAAIKHLRQKWPDILFFGMEPAIKPGAKSTKTGKVGVLATAGTFKSQRYTHLMHSYASEVELIENPCLGLVERVENGQLEGDDLENYLNTILQPMLDNDVDTFVLGCTHYPFLLPTLRKMLGTDVSIIDPAPALARQLKRVLEREGLLAFEQTPIYEFNTSGPSGTFNELALKLLGFSVMVQQNVVI